MSACGCAGCFTSPIAMNMYAEAFASVGALDKLEAFACKNGAAFYGLPPNDATFKLRLSRAGGGYAVPASFPFADGSVAPLRAGETLPWAVAKEEAVQVEVGDAP